MASVTSLMNSTSSTSSLYGNRNVISGLASGLDTESLIENSIAGYKSKVTSLQQKMTQMQWKQDAYRSLITQMNNLLNKYTSYTSSTNLFSSSFFSKAINTVANGANAAKVSATGKSSSNVSVDAIKQLAQAASYTVGTNHLVSSGSGTSGIEWATPVETSGVAGSLTLEYGGGSEKSGSVFTLSFSEDEVFNSAQEMADAINDKLKEKRVTSTNGSSSADNYLEAFVDATGRVAIKDKKNNNFRITGVSGDGMSKIFSETERGSMAASEKPVGASELVKSNDREEYLKNQTIYVNLDGKNKSIKLSDILESDTYKNASGTDKTQALASALNERLGKEFNGKVSVTAEGGALKFAGPEGNGSTLKVSGGNEAVNKALGLGEGGYSTTLQTNWSLERVLGDSVNWTAGTDKDGKAVKTATMKINDTEFTFKSTDTIKDVMDKVNSSEAGVEIKYSSLTGRFAITAKETGADSKVDIGGNLGVALFGDVSAKQKRYNQIVNSLANEKNWTPENSPSGTEPNDVRKARLEKELNSLGYKGGQDAIFSVTVNGEQMELKRSSNTVDLDGMSVTLKGAFGYKEDGTIDPAAEKITFTTKSDSDKVVDAVKSFVEDYNKLVTELHGAYSTMPLQNSKKQYYLPLTEEEQAKSTESYIKSYEEKAKTGLLFGDNDLSSLYTRLTQSVQGTGEIGQMLRSIGLSVEYSNGLSTLSLDEDKLRSALDSDPDKVKTAFTASTSTGASANGMMAGLKSTLEMYGKASTGNPGILVNKAGTTLSSYSLSNNEIQDQIDNIQKQIEKWQDKMSDRIDYYTNQFTQLEMLINQMNSQSSALAGMMGG